MSELSNGVLVHHSTLGLGKVVALEPTAVLLTLLQVAPADA